MLEASALWLVPGAEHPVFRRYAEFFGGLFQRFVALDYRAQYLDLGPRQLEQRILQAVETHRPDLLLYAQFPNSYSYVAPAFIASLRERCRVVGLGFDDEIYFEQAKYFYFQCDAVITTDIPDAERLRAAGVAVHLAQLQQPHVAAGTQALSQEDIPVSFVGDMTKPGRRELVRVLQDAGIAVADYGKGSRNGPLSDVEVVDVFRRSRINLNFTRTNPPAWVLRYDPKRALAGQIKGRPFELAAMRKFCLCEWAPCVDYWFRPDFEIGIFRNGEELVAAVNQYLRNSAERESIASAAHERYKAQYAPHVQFRRIFSDILADRRESAVRKAAPADPIFYESFGRSRAVAFLHALRSGRAVRAVGETLSRESSHAGYWRGFIGGLRDTVSTQLRRS